MVYVLSKNGQPLMPTTRHGKVRRMLKSGLAKVKSRCPFTIQLTYEPETQETQSVEVGDDTGSKHNGVSAVAVYPNGREVEVYASETLMRADITNLLSTRREFRRSRRNRTTRYRQPRFDNRVHSKHKGWLAPTVENKILTHRKELDYVCSILPVTKVTIETASFDTQRLKADLKGLKCPEGKEYQEGDQMGFWNVREYVLFRDGHKCQCCKGRSGDKMKDATFMGIMRWTFFNRVKKELNAKDIEVRMTFGYITKHERIKHNLEKTHCIDARVISGHPEAEPLGYYFLKKKVRCHNRQIHKATINKGGTRKLNQSAYEVKGFRLFDTVGADGREWYIHGKRIKGSFVLKNLDGNMIQKVPSKIKLLSIQHNHMITERRALLPT